VRICSALAGVAFIVAFVATGSGARAQVPVPPLGSIGAPHDKNLAELLDKNQPDDAARYWGENRSYFWDNAESNKALLARLRSAVNTPHDLRMAEAEVILKPFAAQPMSLIEWASVIRAISAARSALDAYRALPIAIDDSLRSERFIALDGTLNEVVQVYVANAPAAFAQYDHLGNPVFTRTYPVDVPDEVIAAGYLAMKPRLEAASVGEIAKLTEAYGKVLTARQREELSRFAAQARYRELVPGGRLTAEAATKIISEIIAGRLDASSLPVRLSFYWSQEAAKAGEVPVALKAPANVSMREAQRRELLTRLAEADVVVFMDVDKPTLRKDTRSTRREYSRYKSTERQVLNPAYLDAQAQVQQKQMEQMRAESGGGFSFSLDPIALVAGLAKEAYTQTKTFAAKAQLKMAQDQLAGTPRMLTEDVMGDYQYTISDVEMTRRVPLAIYLVDMKSGGYLKQTTEITERQRFESVDDLHPRDPERDQILSRFPAATALTQYLASPVAIEAGMVLTTGLGVVQGEVAMQPLAALPQDIERGAVQAPLALALAAPGHCDAFFDNFVEQLKNGRCAAEAENLKGLAEAVGGASRGVAESGILTTTRTPELYKIVPANDERWVTAAESAQPNCSAPLAVRNPQDAFMECVRVISCGARAAACGRELTRQNRAMGCPEASQRCMVVYPIPQ
jgi:hypothetical protein